MTADFVRVLAEAAGVIVALTAMLKLLWTQRRMKTSFETHLVEELDKRDNKIRLIEDDLEVCKTSHAHKDLELINVRAKEREQERMFMEVRAEKRELERLVFMLNGQINVLMASQFGVRAPALLQADKPA